MYLGACISVGSVYLLYFTRRSREFYGRSGAAEQDADTIDEGGP